MKTREGASDKITALVDKTGERQDSEVFHFVLFYNEEPLYDATFVCSSFQLIKLKVMDELRTKIDSLDPATTSIEIVKDSHQLFNKQSLYCPNCGRKLMEGWGTVRGIETKCHRCGKIAVPLTK